jgi:hypothetical protein
VPIALSGFIFVSRQLFHRVFQTFLMTVAVLQLPNLPDKMTKSWIWTERDIALAQLRMESVFVLAVSLVPSPASTDPPSARSRNPPRVQGRKPSEPWTKTKAKRILGGWKIWYGAQRLRPFLLIDEITDRRRSLNRHALPRILPPLYMLWNNAASGLGTVMPFWLKGWNKPGQPIVYTVPQINHYPLPTSASDGLSPFSG